MIRFGISGLPLEEGDDAAFLDGLAAEGHRAFELSFTKGFPWKEKRCSGFGEWPVSGPWASTRRADQTVPGSGPVA